MACSNTSSRLAAILSLGLSLGLTAPGAAQALGERLVLEKGKDFSVEASTGILVGTTHEIVYEPAVSADYVLSQLDWGLKPLVYYGLAFELGGKTGVYWTIGLRSGLSGRTGTIMDSDYMNGDGVKTNLSVSDNYTEDALLADLALGWRFPLDPDLLLEAYGAINYMHFKFTARDGYYQYGDKNATTGQYAPYTEGTAYSLTGTGIVYQQDFLALSLGLGAEWTPRQNLRLSASLLFSPLVSAQALDNHVVRYLDFADTMSGGWLLEPRLESSWAISKRNRFVLSLAYRLIRGLKGDEVVTGTTGADTFYTNAGYAPTEYIHAGQSQSYTDTAGAAFEALDLAMTLRMGL